MNRCLLRCVTSIAALAVVAAGASGCADDARSADRSRPSTGPTTTTTTIAASTTTAPRPAGLPGGLTSFGLSDDAGTAWGVGQSLNYGRGVALVDLDGDGWDDVFATDTDSRFRGADFGVSQAYRNDQHGKLVPWDLGIDPADVYENGGAIFGDYTNDGQPDVMLVAGNNTGISHVALYENRLRTEGRFVNTSAEAGITQLPGTWWGAAWGDIDGDGWLDAIVTGAHGTVLYHNDGKRHLVDETDARGLGVYRTDPIVKNPLFVDLDNDSRPEIVSGGGTPFAVLHNDGTGHFADVTMTAFNFPMPPKWWVYGFGAVAADFNQDGFEDLYLSRLFWADALLLNNGDGTFSRHWTDLGFDAIRLPEEGPDVPPTPPVQSAAIDTSLGSPQWSATDESPPEAWENTMGLTVGDLDLNGVPDLMLGSGDPSATNPDLIFCGQLGGPAGVEFKRCQGTTMKELGDTRGHGVAMGDLDRDGTVDLFVNPGGFPPFDADRGTDTREHRHLYLGTGDGSKTASVRLTTDGRTAVGARMKVATTPPLYATVRSAQGFQSQASDEQIIPLTAPAEVSVTWPDGSTTKRTVSPGERVTIAQP